MKIINAHKLVKVIRLILVMENIDVFLIVQNIVNILLKTIVMIIALSIILNINMTTLNALKIAQVKSLIYIIILVINLQFKENFIILIKQLLINVTL